MYVILIRVTMINMSHLKVGLFNSGSLNTGQDEFIAALEVLSPDILAVNETWLQSGQDDKAPKIAGYRLMHSPRPASIRGGRGEGVGFYVRRGVNIRICPYPIVPSVEQMWLRLTVHQKTVIIGTAYRAPWQDVISFLDALTDSIASFPKCDHLVLLGDFNIDMLNPNNSKLPLLKQFLQALTLDQVITEPTHFTDHSQTLIDVVCTDTKVRRVAVKYTPDLGHHAMILVEFNIKKEKILPRLVTYRPLKSIVMELFSSDLDNIDWDYFNSTHDINDLVLVLTSTIVSLFDLHAPLKTKKFKGPPHPWITDTVKTMIKIRDSYHERCRLLGSDEFKKCYKDMKHLVIAAIESEKSAFFKDNINKNINNSRQLWKNLKNNILPNSKQTADLPPQFDNPNLINSHFLNVPGNNHVDISQLTFYEYHRFGSETFSFDSVSEDAVLKVIQSFKSNAQGIDGITLEMLFMTLPQSLPAITNIINGSMSSGMFPDSWKVAVVKPIPKNNQPSSLGDLRPISLLPCLSKILEKIVCMQLIKFLETHHLLPQLQSGFRQRHSTSTALLDIVDNLLAAQDQGKCSILVLLDFSRAFDSINISLLLSKLAYYGFDHNTVKWFSSYLEGRQQCTELRLPNGTCSRSSLCPVPRGVPQGSILGPILFILYSADIVTNISHCKFHVYADDLQLYYSFFPSDCSNAVNMINSDLAQVHQWSKSNSLVLNPKKSKYMLFGTKAGLRKLSGVQLDVAVNGECVEYVKEAKSLGLTLDSHLRFENHVADGVRNSFYRLKILYKIRSYISEDVRITLCESLVLSRLNYCDVVYGTCLLGRTEKLIQRVQNACARFCFHIPPRTHVTPFLNSSNLLKMKARRLLHLATLLFGVVSGRIPPYLYSKLKWVQDESLYQKRTCTHVFVTPRHKSMAFRGSFRFAASRCWNDLPPPIRALKTVTSFKFALKKELLLLQRGS